MVASTSRITLGQNTLKRTADEMTDPQDADKGRKRRRPFPEDPQAMIKFIDNLILEDSTPQFLTRHKRPATKRGGASR